MERNLAKTTGNIILVSQQGLVMSYTVEIKRSAFQGNTAVFSEFNDGGLHHDFSNKQEAKKWAERLSLRGERDVYIRNANELDQDPSVDGYLVGR